MSRIGVVAECSLTTSHSRRERLSAGIAFESSLTTILEGCVQKRANMSTVAIMVAFILFKNKVPDEI